MPEEPLIGMVGRPEGAEVVEATVNELLEGSVGNPDAAVDTVDVPELPINPEDELLEGVGNPDGAEEAPLYHGQHRGVDWTGTHSHRHRRADGGSRSNVGAWE